MPARVVVFDIGGVLEVNPSTGWDARWEARLSLPTGEINRRLEHVWQAGMVGRITEQDVARDMGNLLGLDEEEVRALLVETWDEYLGTANAELIRYFASLRQRCQTAIISNSFVGAREREQERYDFESVCELIVYSHEVGVAKPDRRIFELACERLAVSPEDCIFVDDVTENIEAASDFGMRVVHFRDNEQTIRELETALRI